MVYFGGWLTLNQMWLPVPKYPGVAQNMGQFTPIRFLVFVSVSAQLKLKLNRLVRL